jgi:hypothetical protein
VSQEAYNSGIGGYTWKRRCLYHERPLQDERVGYPILWEVRYDYACLLVPSLKKFVVLLLICFLCMEAHHCPPGSGVNSVTHVPEVPFSS